MKSLILSTILVLLSAIVFAQKNHTPLTPAEQLNKTYCTGLFSTPDGIYFDLVNDEHTSSANTYFNILDWLRGRVAGLEVNDVRGIKVPVIRNSLAAIFVDEVRADASYLNMLPVADIAMIKIIRSPFIGAPGAASAIAIYTKDGEEEEDI